MADETRPDPRSGLGDLGEWTPAFPGQRPPLEPGHRKTEKHGAYSERKVRPRAEEWMKRLDATMRAGASEGGVYASLDDIARAQLARSLARADLIEEDLDSRGAYLDPGGELTSAAMFLFRLDRQILAQLRELGLTVKSRAEIGLNVAGAEELISRTEVRALIVQVVLAAMPLIAGENRAEYRRVIGELSVGVAGDEVIDQGGDSDGH